ncbi:hypothetical protein EUTSA_v10021342mg [Eutrema salsugineum]|uniref:PPM-type phosphatase domain-containing protein n=1 Tax=Eutrema salsugineum TaxID=72664 RepID=V4LUL0_EUTSA|nr:putative protein phosphatase 2C-like protein 44 [Eutrema salsugineum]ESQ47489.1 hypothetical protein EUTSA_v10021342mg [Eutrema salsugineum]
MGFWDFPFMLKAFRFRRLVVRDGRRRKKKKPSWLTPVSHGYYTIDRLSHIDRSSSADSVFVQREQQNEELEIWLFAVSNAGTGKEIVKYIQNHLFDKLPNEHGIMRKCKETMRRAYVEEKRSGGSAASVTVVNGEKLAMASIGGHRVVVCRDGEAHQIKDNNRKSSTRNWSNFIFPVCYQREMEDESDPRNQELALVTEKIDSDIEFIIIGSSGIWEVIKNEEAINLIRHIEDPQEAAKCLAKEALNRISKSEISCIVIRFD